MATSYQHAFELHGKENIPEHGILIVPNRLGFDELLHLEKFFSERNVVFMIEKNMVYDPLLHAHLDKDDVSAMEFTCDEDSAAAFKKELHTCLAAGDATRKISILEAPRPNRKIGFQGIPVISSRGSGFQGEGFCKGNCEGLENRFSRALLFDLDRFQRIRFL